VSLPARGRPPQAAARRAGLEFVEKLLTTNLTSMDTTERDAGMIGHRTRVPHPLRHVDRGGLLIALEYSCCA
jgi:hypothetical protein